MKELYVKKFEIFAIFFCIALINLGTQIQKAQTWFTIADFGLNQLLVLS